MDLKLTFSRDKSRLLLFVVVLQFLLYFYIIELSVLRVFNWIDAFFSFVSLYKRMAFEILPAISDLPARSCVKSGFSQRKTISAIIYRLGKSPPLPTHTRNDFLRCPCWKRMRVAANRVAAKLNNRRWEKWIMAG